MTAERHRHAHARRAAGSWGGLAAVRGQLERRVPRDPFRVDEGKALEVLSARWSGLYVIKIRDGTYEATRKQRPHETFGASTPDELNRLIIADWGSW